MRKTLTALPLIALVIAGCAAAPAATETADAAVSEPIASPVATLAREAAVPQQADNDYYLNAQAAIDTKIDARGLRPAKNVILFVGDGMSIPTVTAARIYAGQKRGVDGESYKLTMEQLPYSALSKTYSHDAQIADSASTATAMMSGVKTNSRTLGITGDAAYDNCASIEGHKTDSIFEIAEQAGLATGLVTTARLTHATPGAAYSKTPNRDWEAYVGHGGAAAGSCEDIATQFIDWPAGDGFEVAMGGGRSAFLAGGAEDPEYPGKTSDRKDQRDLLADWTAKPAHKLIIDREGFEAQDFASEDKVLALFEPSHMEYELDRADDPAGEPSISEMTRAAITRLSQDPDGYVLLVEGGRIDHAHHAGNAARALEEADQFDQAIKTALDMTNSDDTLIIVTADHSHTLTISGYARRGNPILGLSSTSLDGTPDKALDGMPYTTLGYMNGPGACTATEDGFDCTRKDLTGVDTTDKDFRQQSLYPMWSETHGGDDVAIFASGPGSELISGVMEQNEIFQVMGRASGLVAGPEGE
ncbi:alkaline phosphatase [Hyphomonas adhaerens MHS-3]|uniref:Alkaline phosphatase n=1 Tax=Hyphomonas adhaerens MHS-3 TaxID=1280949 RepID=A0A069E4Q0_9PROT|nr:alkaline phosphatase [Hyphomonas adhaerens]KCZ85027.1 alkaline phosphatase [Hyphomonas adhaerens MHS-3]